MKKQTILEEASKIISEDRCKDYGDVNVSFNQIAKIWGGLLNVEITSKQVALCMIGLKLQRESFSHKRDNLVDTVGYTLLLEQLNETK